MHHALHMRYTSCIMIDGLDDHQLSQKQEVLLPQKSRYTMTLEHRRRHAVTVQEIDVAAITQMATEFLGGWRRRPTREHGLEAGCCRAEGMPPWDARRVRRSTGGLRRSAV